MNDRDETESLSAECVSSTYEPTGVRNWAGEADELRLPTNEEVVTRIQTGIAEAYPVPHISLIVNLAVSMSHSLQQRRHINEIVRTEYMLQHEEVLTAAERLGQPERDAEEGMRETIMAKQYP